MHSLSHPCSANLNTHHGLTNAVVMPYVLSWNRPALSEKMQRLAAYLNLSQHSFNGVLDWILELRNNIGVPDTLSELGVTPEHAQTLCAAGVRRSFHRRQSDPGDGRGFCSVVSKLHRGKLNTATA